MTREEVIHFNVYCDESRHTSDPQDSYMVLGAITCPRDSKRNIVHHIHRLKRQFAAQGEFGWKRVSPNRQEFYLSLIDFFQREENLSFRCLIADRQKLDHNTYSGGDKELGFYKLYYQLLVHWLKPGCSYHVYLDWHQNRDQHRFSDLCHILAKKLSGRARIECLEPVTSRHHPLIELTDLFIGAVGYAWNDRNTSQIKLRFCQHLAKSIGFSTLKTSTGPENKKFNIFNFQGR